MITKEALRLLKNKTPFTRNLNKQFEAKFAVDGAKIGDTINIRKPNKYAVTTGATLTIQDTVDVSVALTLDTQKHVGMAFSSKDLALSIDEFSDRIIAPAVTALGADVDYANFAAMYKKVYSSVGVPSATALPSTLKGFGFAKAKIALLGGPQSPLKGIVNPLVEATMVDGLKTLFHSTNEIKKQYEDGVMGYAAGMEFLMSQSVPSHTVGTADGAPQVKTTITAQGTTSVVIDTITTATLTGSYKAGDVVTFGAVFAVNPLTKVSTGELAQFVVQADVNAASNESTISVLPAMYTTGVNQNITAFPLDNALVKVFGGTTSAYAGIVSPQNLVFHKDAFGFGCADLPLPKGVDMASRASDSESGLSIRLIRDYDSTNDRIVTRLDILSGIVCMYPEFACRVVGQPA